MKSYILARKVFFRVKFFKWMFLSQNRGGRWRCRLCRFDQELRWVDFAFFSLFIRFLRKNLKKASEINLAAHRKNYAMIHSSTFLEKRSTNQRAGLWLINLKNDSSYVEN